MSRWTEGIAAILCACPPSGCSPVSHAPDSVSDESQISLTSRLFNHMFPVEFFQNWPEGRIPGYPLGLSQAAFVPESSRLVALAGLSGSVALYNLEDRRVLWVADGGTAPLPPSGHCVSGVCYGLALAANARHVAVADQGRVRLYNLDTGALEKVLIHGEAEGERSYLHTSSLQFSNNGRLLASNNDVNVDVWDVESGRNLGVVQPPEDRNPIVGISFDDRTGALWVATATWVSSGAGGAIMGERDPIHLIAYENREGSWAMTSGGDREFSTPHPDLLSKHLGMAVSQPSQGSRLAAFTVFARDGRRQPITHLFDLDSGRLLGSQDDFLVDQDSHFSTSLSELVSVQGEGRLQRWNFSTGEVTGLVLRAEYRAGLILDACGLFPDPGNRDTLAAKRYAFSPTANVMVCLGESLEPHIERGAIVPSTVRGSLGFQVFSLQ